MCCKNSKRKITALVLTFMAGFLTVSVLHEPDNIVVNSANISANILQKNGERNFAQESLDNFNKNKFINIEEDKDFRCLDCNTKNNLSADYSQNNSDLRLVSKPKTKYSDSALENKIQGTVILRVEFLANGGIGKMSALKGLSKGLTEQFLASAREIKFEPAIKNGVLQTVTKRVQYTFTIH